MRKSSLPLSLYIHVPWCIQKCPYCDFNSHTYKQSPDYASYIAHLLSDLKNDLPLTSGRPISSIFIGGGTPSLLGADLIDQLLSGIRDTIDIVQDAEITLEANPNSVDRLKFSGYQSAGINRISVGIQSFSADKLKKLGRVHDPVDAEKAARLAMSLDLHSVNIDLMHGLPDQCCTEALFDLEKAIALGTPHLSWYQLTIEPNTLFGSKPPKLPDETILWTIQEQGHQRLLSAGYQQYEISAYAKPGYQCQHNVNYWRYGDYLGIGCGAHGKLTQQDGQILRTVKTRHPRGYLSGNYSEKQSFVDENARPFEFFMNRFRLIEPTPKADFVLRTFMDPCQIEKPINAALKHNYLTEDEDYWYITDHGKQFLNDLLLLFL